MPALTAINALFNLSNSFEHSYMVSLSLLSIDYLIELRRSYSNCFNIFDFAFSDLIFGLILT